MSNAFSLQRNKLCYNCSCKTDITDTGADRDPASPPTGNAHKLTYAASARLKPLAAADEPYALKLTALPNLSILSRRQC